MKSAARGKPTSDVEVTNVSRHGFWLLIDARELFVSFKQFPWFREVSIGELCNVELPHSGHLHWPDLDVDLAVESIEHSKRFPLLSRGRPNKLQPTRAVQRKGKRAAARRGPRG
ncbi:MAG TPA: DUF2442 domain-containing protein [Candidatus Dormibacteraeota bacterium]|nr:DUF2442 domain-containing protein [Candidatus Dormibacteraeota bacterium]